MQCMRSLHQAKYIASFRGCRCIKTSVGLNKKAKRPLFYKTKKNELENNEELHKAPINNSGITPSNFENETLFSFDERAEKIDWNFGSSDSDLKYDDYLLNKNELYSVKSVFVIQPLLTDKNQQIEFQTTNAKLQLAEAVALVNSIPGWSVMGTLVVKTKTLDRVEIFSKMDTARIAENIRDAASISTVFISLEKLKTVQKYYLEKATGIEDIFDRYLLVLSIFKLRATSKQACLQVALAEIPYLKMMIETDTSGNRPSGGFSYIGGRGEKPRELFRRRFKAQELKIKRRLALLEKNRDLQRASRKRTGVPVVAIVGYTNCGKTTLIKSLTGSERLNPENKLFATLDVTAHAAVTTRNNIRYILIDTVGFLSNLPHLLIDAFRATMQDMLLADVVVHICDISHPDRTFQRQNVVQVLKNLNISPNLLNNIIEVHNKIDKVEESERERLKETGCLQISATSGRGLPELSNIIEEEIIRVTQSGMKVYRVPAATPHLQWLETYASVRYAEGDGDYHLKVYLTITKAMELKFAANFNDFEILNS